MWANLKMGDFARNEKKNRENGIKPASGQSCIFQYLTFKFNIYVYRPRLPFWPNTSPWVRLIYETDLAVI